MADITVRDTTEAVYDVLREEAERHGRSLNQKIVHRLEASLRAPPIDPEANLERIRAARKRLRELPPLDDAFPERARREGRA